MYRLSLQIDLVRVCLSSEVFNLNQAVKVSDKALSSLEKAEANFEKLADVWDKHRNDGRVQNMLRRKQPKPPGPNTVVFLNLFWEPEHSSQRLSSHCMELFGSRIVEIAVSSVINDTREQFRILSSFDKKAFEHLRPPPEKKPKAKSDSTKFKQGDHVIVHGLRNKSELNGKRGKILKWLQSKGRYEVKLNKEKKSISILPSNIKIDDDSDSSDDNGDNAPDGQGMGKRTIDRTVKPRQMQSQANPRFLDTSSSDDDDSDEPPALNDRDQSTSEDSSSSSDSVPSLLERGNKSNSSDSSEDDDTDSSSSTPPALMRKDNSSSDDEDIPFLISPNQQSSSSSDESGPRHRVQRGRGSTRNNTGREEGGRRGRGGRGRRK